MLFLTFIMAAALPQIGESEQTAMTRLGSKLKLVHSNRRSRTLQIERVRVAGHLARARFHVQPDTLKIYSITVSMAGLEPCRDYERALRAPRGKPDEAEWGTRAYELTWLAKGALPATHFWLHAYDGVTTKCDVTFGPRAPT